MSKYIFDYDDGDFAMSISDSMAMDSDGNLMMRMGDHMAMDMDTGDIHMISSWSDDDEEYLAVRSGSSALQSKRCWSSIMCMRGMRLWLSRSRR